MTTLDVSQPDFSAKPTTRRPDPSDRAMSRRDGRHRADNARLPHLWRDIEADAEMRTAKSTASKTSISGLSSIHSGTQRVNKSTSNLCGGSHELGIQSCEASITMIEATARDGHSLFTDRADRDGAFTKDSYFAGLFPVSPQVQPSRHFPKDLRYRIVISRPQRSC